MKFKDLLPGDYYRHRRSKKVSLILTAPKLDTDYDMEAETAGVKIEIIRWCILYNSKIELPFTNHDYDIPSEVYVIRNGVHINGPLINS